MTLDTWVVAGVVAIVAVVALRWWVFTCGERWMTELKFLFIQGLRSEDAYLEAKRRAKNPPLNVRVLRWIQKNRRVT